MTFSVITFRIMAFSTMTFSKMPFSIMQHTDIQHNNNKLKVTLSIMTHNLTAKHCYTDFRLCSLSFMLSFTYKPFMLSVIKQSIVMLSVVAPKCCLPHAQAF
jgi:hypothetical protein